MKLRLAIGSFFAVLLATAAGAEQIYRWVDEQGLVHYSDVPQDGAETVVLQPPATYSAPRPATTPSGSRQPVTDDEQDGYEGLTIVSPGAEETIWNTAGVIKVAVSPTPALLEGHSVNIYLNGQLIAEKAPTSLSAELTEVPRGEHTVTAEILDANGRVLMSAQPITFFYRQTLIPNINTPRIRPSPAVRPRPRALQLPARPANRPV
ncbi:MAG: DUF4124 domain-containing protein [Halieaceae bacterium]|jgi:hypothetical protein|nr:DUF4124 domain-containing protein [Halieaceae bacterium]